jgi:hypothetical protein
MDSTRIGKNFGYMARTLKGRPEHEFETAAAAVLEHHFDCHDHCGDWCKRKLELASERKASVKYYRCKTRDAKLYALLSETIARFVTKERLDEMAHELDTNMNEAFNQICTWFAPKNKVFAGSYSLHNRIAFAVGINSLGVLQFFKRLFRKLGITMTDNVAHYLEIKEETRVKKLAKEKTSSFKKEKNKRKYEKLKEHTLKAKMELHKRHGTYRKGMNLDDPIEVKDEQEAVENDASAMIPATKKQKTMGFCEYCGKKGHAMKKSKKCTAVEGSSKIYRKVDGTLLTEPQQYVAANRLTDAENDSNDCDNFDSMPLVEMPGEQYSFDVEGQMQPSDMFGSDAWECDSDDESVALVGGTL